MLPHTTRFRSDDGEPSREDSPAWPLEPGAWAEDGVAPRSRARVLGRALTLWLPAAAILAAALGLLEATDGGAARSLERRQSLELDVAARLVRGRLSAARADLELLGVSTVVERYIRDPTPSRRADLSRELLGFTAYRPWCTGVGVVIPHAPAARAGRESTGAQCPRELIGAVQALPASEVLLGHTGDEWPSGRLCLGLPLEGPPSGMALLAEIDPAALFADLDGLLTGPVPTVFDGSGHHVAGPAPRSLATRAGGRAMGLAGWHGPSAGTWHVAPAWVGAARAAASFWMRHRHLLLGAALLLVLAAAALGVAWTIEARRAAEGDPRRRLGTRAALCDPEGRPVGVAGASVDVAASGPTPLPDAPLPDAASCSSQCPPGMPATGLDSAPGGPSTASITARSAPAGGVVSLPAGKGDAEAASLPIPPPPGRPRSWRALVVEDNRVNQRVASAQLRQMGGEVDLVANGLEAVEAARRSRYDIVLMDCRMPVLDGYDATRRIRADEVEGSHVPIVALTANAIRGDRERCLASGMTAYLSKPVDKAALRRVVERYVLGGAPPPSADTGADSDADAVVDVAALERLRALDSGGNELLAEIARDFAEGFHEKLEEMRAAVRCGDALRLESAAHGLKGSAGILGARALVTMSGALEDLGRRGRIAEGAQLLDGLTREFETLQSVLSFALAPVARGALPAAATAPALPPASC